MNLGASFLLIKPLINDPNNGNFVLWVLRPGTKKFPDLSQMDTVVAGADSNDFFKGSRTENSMPGWAVPITFG